MEEYIPKDEPNSAAVNNVNSQADEKKDGAKSTTKSRSFWSGCNCNCNDIVLSFWLLFLLVGSTWFVIGCLSGHAFQSRLTQVLSSQTEIDQKNIFLEYLNLRESLNLRGTLFIAKFDNDQHNDNNEETTKSIKDVDKSIQEILGKKYGSDLLYLARAENSLQIIKLPYFFHLPRQFLVLLLTLSMGVLGSLLRMIRNYFDREPDEDEAFSWYIFRPFLGAITALAVLILLKAGQLTITNSSSIATTEGLNPFFISFIAIISGFLSVQAHDRIRRAGAVIFGSSETPQVSRWLVSSRLKSLGSKDLSSLALYLGKSPKKVQKWFDIEEAVPESAQPIVAAWLDESQRVLFTDLKPDKKKVTTDNPKTVAQVLEETTESNRQLPAEIDRSGVPSPDIERWLIIKEAESLLNSRQLSGLARHANVKKETVEAWFNNDEPVPAQYQVTIKAWLDIPKGVTLFTDENP